MILLLKCKNSRLEQDIKKELIDILSALVDDLVVANPVTNDQAN